MLYGDFTHDAVLASLIQICVLVQQTYQGIHYSTDVLSLVLMKLIWRAFEPLLLYTLLATQNGRLLCACVVPRLMHNLYSGIESMWGPRLVGIEDGLMVLAEDFGICTAPVAGGFEQAIRNKTAWFRTFIVAVAQRWSGCWPPSWRRLILTSRSYHV